MFSESGGCVSLTKCDGTLNGNHHRQVYYLTFLT